MLKTQFKSPILLPVPSTAGQQWIFFHHCTLQIFDRLTTFRRYELIFSRLKHELTPQQLQIQGIDIKPKKEVKTAVRVPEAVKPNGLEALESHETRAETEGKPMGRWTSFTNRRAKFSLPVQKTTGKREDTNHPNRSSQSKWEKSVFKGNAEEGLQNNPKDNCPRGDYIDISLTIGWISKMCSATRTELSVRNQKMWMAERAPLTTRKYYSWTTSKTGFVQESKTPSKCSFGGSTKIFRVSWRRELALLSTVRSKN